jgi:predicted metal-dependent hydrolase
MNPTSSPFPRPFLDFVACFNRGEFWEGHEVLEGPWRGTRSDFYKGLILYASAFVHVQRRNPSGVLAQLRKTERHLVPYRPSYLGLDLEAVLEHAARAAEMVGRTPVEWNSLLPPPLVPEPKLVRGDEPELQSG